MAVNSGNKEVRNAKHWHNYMRQYILEIPGLIGRQRRSE